MRQITELPIKEEIARMKEIPTDKADENLNDLVQRVEKEIVSLEVV